MGGKRMGGRMFGAWLLGLGLAAGGPASAQYSVTYAFNGSTTNGATPWGALTAGGHVLYGMTAEGGSVNSGVVFRVHLDGTGYTNLHSFAGGANDGLSPDAGALLLNGATLYGVTSSGGASNAGVAFAVSTNGTGFTILHTFPGDYTGDAGTPDWSLTLVGAQLYGVSALGGARGALYRMNLNGSGYTNLHLFANGANDGDVPSGGLLAAGAWFFGVTTFGGASNSGVVYRINLDGSGFTNLHSFAGGSGGYFPQGDLACDGTYLYGTTLRGGTANRGIAYRLKTDGTGFKNLHTFVGGSDDGANPNGSLMLDGATLYGTTERGGWVDDGVAYRLTTDGVYSNLHTFTGPTVDLATPAGGLVAVDSVLYGVAVQGSSEGNGGVFALPYTSDLGVALTRCERVPPGLALGWQPNRTGLVFTVEASTGLTDTAWFAVPPTSQWWTAGTAWTNSTAVPGAHLYRIRAKIP